jgi:purine nucleosidase
MPTSVVLIHDAAIDEYMSMLLLSTMPGIELVGSVIVSADCIGGPAMQAAWKLQQFIGQPELGLGLSAARGLNPFPWAYRADCVQQSAVAALQTYGPNPHWPPYPDGDAWLQEFFLRLDGQVTVLCLCPLTPLDMLLTRVPEAAEKIERLVWMGGAINVAGNLDPATLPPVVANPYAEWNVFWDPIAADHVLSSTTFPVVMFPLDITDQAKVAASFMQQLLVDGKTYRYADLARQSYGLVGNEPFYDMWDVTATVYLARPDLFAPPTSMSLKVITDSDKSGAVVVSPQGRPVDVVLNFADLPGFYDYVIQQFRR